MRRFNRKSGEKHSTSLKYHKRISVMCWKRKSKACTVDIIGVPVKKASYGYISIMYQNKKYVYTSRWKKK